MSNRMSMKTALLAAVTVLAVTSVTAARAGAQPAAPADPLWNARLWLTAQAFGLEKDCAVAVLFQAPRFRSIPLPRGGSATSRIASADRQGDELVLAIDMMQRDGRTRRVTLELHLHPVEDIVSVDLIRIGDAEHERISLRYEDAVNDDDEYDLYTDTLVSVYTTLFDSDVIRQRLAR
jgi:hypothetical protein